MPTRRIRPLGAWSGGIVQTLHDSQSLSITLDYAARIRALAYIYEKTLWCKESSRYGYTVINQGMNDLCGRDIVIRQIT